MVWQQNILNNCHKLSGGYAPRNHPPGIGSKLRLLTYLVYLLFLLSVRRDHIFATARPIFTNVSRTLPMAVARSCSGGVVIGSTLEYVQRFFDRDYPGWPVPER